MDLAQALSSLISSLISTQLSPLLLINFNIVELDTDTVDELSLLQHNLFRPWSIQAVSFLGLEHRRGAQPA